MKRYTSRFLKLTALAYMAFPVVYLICAALLFDIPPRQCLRILLSPLYYLVCFWAICAGYGLWEMRRWAWHVFLFSHILVLYGNAVLAADYGESHHKIFGFFFSVLVLAFLTVRLGREIRVPYFLPRIRWWETNPRYRLSVPVTIHRHQGEALTGEILDLSMGGCFIKFRTELNSDEAIRLEFTVFGQEFRPTGTVVWHTHSTVTHPKGVGIKFGPIARPERRLLKAVIHRLKKITTLYSSARYLMNQEDLSKKIEELRASKLEPSDKDEPEKDEALLSAVKK